MSMHDSIAFMVMKMPNRQSGMTTCGPGLYSILMCYMGIHNSTFEACVIDMQLLC